MIRRLVIVVGLFAAVAGAYVFFQSFKAKKIQEFMAGMAAAPQTVSTMVAKVDEWQSRLDAVGSLRAVNGAELSFEVSGVVDTIEFKSGDDVAAGTPLVRLRSIDDLAKLRSLEATAELMRITSERNIKQFRAQAVSQAQLDTDAANLKSALAQVNEQQAIVNKKVLRAPFAGHLGLRMVDLGQYLTAGTPVVTLQSLDPIYADFFLPQQALDEIAVGQAVSAKIDTYPGQSFAGEISAINPKVDTNTRNVQVRATLKNPDHKLLPGMYATVSIVVGAPQRYITVPQTAITFSSYGNTIYLVDNKAPAGAPPQLVARQTFVTTGPTRGDQIAVLKGVNEGDTVVTAGQIKLRNGVGVVVNNTVQPTDDANPKPTEQM